jgi:SAM-dependent methyltransferase
MDYVEAVETAPPGWRHFNIDDVARLPEDVRAKELARVPQHEPDDRVLRAMFWTLVYHLEPERWDELARFEPIHPDLIAALPTGATTAVDVGAGSGRLTEHLAKRSQQVIAIEPSAGLRSILTRRLPAVRAMSGWAEALPVEDECSQLTAACGAFGPDRVVIAELARVTARGGWIALISPEHPEWFEANGWQRITAPPLEAPAHPQWIDDFFGPLDPPHEMVLTGVS